jgi:hypothetical protein
MPKRDVVVFSRTLPPSSSPGVRVLGEGDESRRSEDTVHQAEKMTHSSLRVMSALVAAVLFTLASCKKDSESSSNNEGGSLLFDATSPAAREALATPVSFRLTEANYNQWEQAQRFLDAVPSSAFASSAGASGNPIDRAVATLEASPRARTAIERTGLSVRDFVLETIALAQATEASAGNPPGGVTVPPENVQFVQRYQSRILQDRAERRAARARVNTYGEADTTTSVGAQPPTYKESADVRTNDSTAGSERRPQSDSVRRDGQEPERPKPPVDTIRDTIPERKSGQA